MKSIKYDGRLGGLWAIAGMLAPLAAQTVAPPRAPEATSEERTVMSPFIVSSDTESGYQATTTLAGTRLNTPIKDLAASISIYTKDFIDDIGATDSGTLLVFATGMEAAGATGNFSGNTDDLNTQRSFGEAARVDPQGGTRTRGLAAPTFTRGYFATSIAMDSYNTSNVTVNRGPNAILFGVGSAAGVVDTSLLGAELSGNKHKVSVRYGSNDALRESIDINRVLIPKKLAARVILLNDEENFRQRPAYENKRRVYGAIAFEPFKSTSLRGNFETGHTKANRPLMSLPFNNVYQGWFDAGRPSYDWRFYDDPARNPAAAATVANANTEGFLQNTRLTPQVALYYNNPTDTQPAYGFPRIVTTTANAANAIRAGTFHPLVNRDTANDTIRMVMTPGILDIPAGYWTGANVPPGQQPDTVPAGMKAQTFSNYDAFDWRNQMIDENSLQFDTFHTFNLRLEQRGWENRLGIELAFDRQRADRHGRNSFFSNGNTNLVHVDTNVTLVNGQPNPNLGRPFALGTFLRFTDRNEQREGRRATAFARYDFKDLNASWGKWLGRHTLTGLYEGSAVDTVNTVHRLAVRGAVSETIAGNISAATHSFSPVIYMGPSIIGNNNPLKLEPIRVPTFTAGQTFDVTYFTREANATDPGQFVTRPASLIEVLQNNFGQREVIESSAVVLQSYWLQDHLITTFGLRRDKDHFDRVDRTFVENPADRLDPGQVHFGFDDYDFANTPPPFASAEIKSYGIVLRWPRKLLPLPKGSDLSLFYNSSSNFTPLGGRVDLYGNPKSSPSGETKEYGLNLSTFNDKFVVRINRFETSIQGASLTPNFVGAATVNAVIQRATVWAVEGNANPHLKAKRDADIELLFSPLPANFRQLYNFSVAGTSPQITAFSRNGNLPGTSDTTDYTATGVELDLVYNPTRNWRMLLNVAKQETIQSNSYPMLKEWFALMKPVWDQLANTPAGNYPTGYQLNTPLPATTQTYGEFLDTNVWVPWATALANEGVASAEQRKWRFNFVTNYTFRSGSIFGDKLKGFGIGAGVRWQDKLGLGYPTTRNPDSTVNVDIKNPYYAPSELNVNAWVSYERKIWRGIGWKAQINVNNLIGDNELIGTNVQSWSGQIATYRLPPERRWYLTNTFSF